MLLILMLLAAAIAYYIQKMMFQKNFHKGLCAKVTFETSYIEEGGSASIKEVIENKKWMPLPVVHMSFRTGNGISFGNLENINVSDTTSRREVFSLLWNQRITRRLEFTGIRRGHYYIKTADVNVYNFLMTRNYYMEFPQDTQLYVYPKHIPTDRLNILMERIFGMLESRQKFYEDPLNFAGIREYAPGDEMKRVNWKASAKSSELMVNVYDSVMAQKVTICLDLSDKGIWKQQKLAEEAIRITASLCQRLLKAGAQVAVYSNGVLGTTGENLKIPYGKDPQKVHRILRALSDLQLSKDTKSVEEMFAQASKETEGKNGVFLLISKNLEEGYGKFMKEVVQGNKGEFSCMHVIPYHRSLTGEQPPLEVIEGVQQMLWEVEA